jgi:hypothetical protein
MFKKTLLAAGLIAVSSAGLAATWQNELTTAVEHTDEGIEGVAAGTGVPVIAGLIRLGASYAANDTITFTLNQAKASNSAWPDNLYSNIDAAAQVAANGVEINAAAGFAAGSASITISNSGAVEIAKVRVGDMINIEDDATNYFVTSKNAAETVIGISPKLTQLAADNKDITVATTHSFTLDRLDSDATSATYRVAATPTGGTTTIGTLIPTPTVNVTSAGLIAADATISMTAKTAGGAAMDTLTGAFTIAKSSPTFKQTITAFNGIVDVEQARKAFTGGTATTGGDVLTIATTTDPGTAGVSMSTSNANVLTVNGAVAQTATTQGKTVHTITSDYNWLDTAAATAGVQTTGVTVAGGAAAAVINAAGTTATITDAGAVAASTTMTISKTATSAANVIPESVFTGSTTYSYTSGTAKTKTVTFAGGKFTLNGASVTAYGVPMGSTVSRFLWVNNKGAIPAVVTADVVAAGSSYGPYVLGTAAAKTAMSLAGALDTALANAGVTLADNSRANVTFTAPVKAADVTVSAAYKHIADADRLTIETSDTTVGAISCSGTTSANAFTGVQVAATAAITSQGSAAGTSTDACTNAK